MPQPASGIYLPLQATETGNARLAGGVEKIRQSVAAILDTPVGSLPFQERFGSRLQTLQFEPNDALLVSLMRTFIRQALTDNEPRVSIQDFAFQTTPAAISCRLELRVVGSGEPLTIDYTLSRQ